MNTEKKEATPWRRDTASFLEYISFFWTFYLLKLGQTKQFTPDEIDDLGSKAKSDYLLRQFLSQWKQELADNPSNPRLYKPIFNSIGKRRFVLIVLLYHMRNLIAFFYVVFLQQILAFIEDNNHITIEECLGYCAGISICSFIPTFLHHIFYYESTRMGIEVKQTLSGAILHKSFEISPNSVASAQVMNLMTVDCQRFEELLHFLPIGITAVTTLIPLMLGICFVFGQWYPILGMIVFFTMYVKSLYGI